MRYAIYCANYGALGDARTLIDLACEAERAGWDGFFVYDHIVIDRRRATPSVDPWTVLAVVAERTRLTLGPLITPVARRRPWELAHQTIALNRLSEGRLVLGVGLGEPPDHEAFGEPTTLLQRGNRLDEGLDLLQALWSGESVTHEGAWRLDTAALAPGPLADRPIPIWVAGRYGSSRPLRRAARFDGFFPINARWDLDDLLSVAQLRETVAALRAQRGDLDCFDVINAGISVAGGGTEARQFADAGASWWLEILEPRRGHLHELRARVAAGPPNGSR
jgi:alkanesulfonate monooxygenase SsuD/methylene tetrahydromethanopterin reductase-like flavin-dependent oxidoreductase (luciferase family)